ncbi:MAG: YfiR family protein [Phycisphaerae bacterium]|nr:YfiR family protein [Phycisphaerae bacterium]
MSFCGSSLQDALTFSGQLRAGRRVWTAAAAVFVLFLLSGPVAAREPPGKGDIAEVYRNKAAALCNFIYFVEWPQARAVAAPGKGSYVVAIIGEDPECDRLERDRGSLAEHMSVRIKRFGRYKEGLDIEACHTLFVCRSEGEHVESILERLKGKPVLTVADWPGFLRAGGMIELVKMEDTIQWKINQAPVKASGLHLSMQLMRNATAVVCIPEADCTREPGDRSKDADAAEGDAKGKAPGP